MILLDNVDSKDKWAGYKRTVFTEFRSALVRYFSSTLPSVAIMTGSHMGGLEQAIQLLQATKCPLICCDVRRRDKIEKPESREELIRQGKENFDEWRAKFLTMESGPMTDNFLRCNIDDAHGQRNSDRAS